MKYLSFFWALFLVAAVNRPAFAGPDAAGGQNAQAYSARGVVEQIAADRRQITIKHQAIPGYMMAMTMDFPVKDTNELNGISPRDEITFELVVCENDDWIENVRLVAHHVDTVTNNVFVFHTEDLELKPGELLPDGELTAEDGSKIRFSDFRGRALAFTFFFTRCPLPDFCPRMNLNFSETRQLLLANSAAPTNWEFLSVSFDPEADTPEALANYANFYRAGDASHWLFAVASTNVVASLAPRLDLMIVHQGVNISHNLRTVVLDAQGRIACQLDGNNWTPQQLAEAMLKAMAAK